MSSENLRSINMSSENLRSIDMSSENPRSINTSYKVDDIPTLIPNKNVSIVPRKEGYILTDLR